MIITRPRGLRDRNVVMRKLKTYLYIQASGKLFRQMCWTVGLRINPQRIVVFFLLLLICLLLLYFMSLEKTGKPKILLRVLMFFVIF